MPPNRQSINWDTTAKGGIEGGELDYAIKGGDLLGDAFKYNLFTGKKSEGVLHGPARSLLMSLDHTGKSSAVKGAPKIDIFAAQD